ncbi:MAG TPA: undecaprenyl-diphosphatase UppP [Anaerolineales bacterium]
MNIFQSIILGIIEGLTEFIPVSSTAHLLIGEKLMGLNVTGKETLIITTLIQMGPTVALIIYFWTDLWRIIQAVLRGIGRGKPFEDPEARLGWYIVIATIPAAVAGILLKHAVEALFSTPLFEAAIRLLMTAILLGLAEAFGRKNRNQASLNWLDALWVGLAQILAVFPGSSRSGSTISGGMLRNLDRPTAARFAFLMSIPILIAAGVYETYDLFKSQAMNGSLALPILVSILFAGVVGFLSIRWLLGYLNRHPLSIFAIYCAVIGLISMGFALATR